MSQRNRLMYDCMKCIYLSDFWIRPFARGCLLQTDFFIAKSLRELMGHGTGSRTVELASRYSNWRPVVQSVLRTLA